MLPPEKKPPASVVPETPVTTRTEQLLDSHEAAALLKVHPRTLQRLAQRGEIAGVQVGKLWRFRASSISDWIDQRLAS
jgi:excisionase family DNA binding protein